MRLVLIAGALVVLTGCLCSRIEGSGKSARETRELAPFAVVEVSGVFRVAIAVATGPAPRVEIEGDDNLLPHVRATVVGDRLTLDLDTWGVSPRLPLVATVRTPSLRAIEANGANTVNATGVVGDELAVEANGSTGIALKGQVGRLRLDLNGSAEVDALGLVSKSSDVDIAGSGNVVVCATEKLRIDLSGSGEVAYACEPESIEQDITGSGRVVKK